MRSGQLRCLTGAVFLFYFIFGEWGFSGEALVPGEISFLILLSFVFLSSNLKNIYFCRGFLREETFPNGLPITDLFVYFYFFLTGQPLKCADLCQWEVVSLPRIKFLMFIQSNHNIDVWFIKDPSLRLVGEYSFHFNQSKNQRSDLLTPTGKQEVSWFKLDQRTDKPWSRFTFSFDDMKVQFVLNFEIDFSISFKIYVSYVVMKENLYFPK